MKKEKVNFKTKTNETIFLSIINSFIILFTADKLPTFKFYKKNNLPRSGVKSFADSGEMNDTNSLIRSDFYWGLVIVGKE